jgi:Lanthionine synthetase C-like protein
VDKARKARLAELLRIYPREVAAMTYAELTRRQDPPWGNIAHGALGIPAMLVHTHGSKAGTWRASAQRWLSAAERGAKHRRAFEYQRRQLPLHGSIYFGKDGITLLRLLSSCDTNAARERRLRDLLRRCQRMQGQPSGLLEGSTGYLLGLVHLYRKDGEADVLDGANAMASELLASARGRSGWARSKDLSVARGRAGIFHALLSWSRVCGTELPNEFFDDLTLLQKEVERRPPPHVFALPPTMLPSFQRSWCHGSAGLLLLWANAYELTMEKSYLRLARAAAKYTTTPADLTPGPLCCGFGGRAYAMLAMERIDPGGGWPGGGWLERAHGFWSDAMRTMSENNHDWPNGLYQGYPGLVCLAKDLLREPSERVGFPLFEVK